MSEFECTTYLAQTELHSSRNRKTGIVQGEQYTFYDLHNCLMEIENFTHQLQAITTTSVQLLKDAQDKLGSLSREVPEKLNHLIVLQETAIRKQTAILEHSSQAAHIGCVIDPVTHAQAEELIKRATEFQPSSRERAKQ